MIIIINKIEIVHFIYVCNGIIVRKIKVVRHQHDVIKKKRDVIAGKDEERDET